MAKNKDINISPSKGISIIIKNDIVQPLPPKPKKKRRYKRINVLPNTQVPIMQQSAGDTSYIKAQPGRFSLWRDTTTSTPVLTLAQATSQGFIPQLPQITAPPQPPQITAPPPQQALPAPPITLNFGDFMKALQPQEFRGDNQVPQIEDITDTFYQALPEDKKEEYQNAKLEYIAKDIDETAAKAIEDVENNDFYKTQLDPATQTSTKEKTALLAIQQKLEQMKEGNLKGLGTKDVKTLKEPRYPQNKVYEKAYTEGLSKQEESINKRIKELDEIIATKTGQPQARAETERITRNNDLKKIEDLFNKLKQEKKRIKKLLK
jgi:hypothetical protein